MPARLPAFLGLVLLAGFGFLLVRAFRAYRRYRGPMVVTCPETQADAGVRVVAGRAALADSVGRNDLRLADCSRWPESQACGRQCLAQLAASPQDCRIRNRLEAWYRGKSCACCDREIQAIRWHEHKPALLSPERRLLQWEEVPAEGLSRVLATHLPVCGTCNFAESW